jgi:hypothetical protein
MGMRRLVLSSIVLAVVACGDANTMGTPLGLGTGGPVSETDPAASTTDPGDETTGSAESGDESSGGPLDPTLDPSGETSGAPSTPMTCTYASSTFGNPMQELDVIGDPNSPLRLQFNVPGLPSPSQVLGATLRFRGFDLDHPGEEGFIYINDSAGLSIPADEANESAESVPALDVTTLLVEGTNEVLFGPGPLDRSFFRIGDVELIVEADVEACESKDDDAGSGTGNGVAQTLDYTQAEYSQRHNWVWRCNFPEPYAFTAANSKHQSSDCGNAYAPDGSAHGTATFHFQDVVEDDYLVEVHAYHTFNRNPSGARIIVDGVVGTVHQRTDMEGEAYAATAEWGIAHLSGDVDIVLDSAQGGYASDAVSWIRISPVQ